MDRRPLPGDRRYRRGSHRSSFRTALPTSGAKSRVYTSSIFGAVAGRPHDRVGVGAGPERLGDKPGPQRMPTNRSTCAGVNSAAVARPLPVSRRPVRPAYCQQIGRCQALSAKLTLQPSRRRHFHEEAIRHWSPQVQRHSVSRRELSQVCRRSNGATRALQPLDRPGAHSNRPIRMASATAAARSDTPSFSYSRLRVRLDHGGRQE